MSRAKGTENDDDDPEIESDSSFTIVYDDMENPIQTRDRFWRKEGLTLERGAIPRLRCGYSNRWDVTRGVLESLGFGTKIGCSTTHTDVSSTTVSTVATAQDKDVNRINGQDDGVQTIGVEKAEEKSQQPSAGRGAPDCKRTSCVLGQAGIVDDAGKEDVDDAGKQNVDDAGKEKVDGEHSDEPRPSTGLTAPSVLPTQSSSSVSSSSVSLSPVATMSTPGKQDAFSNSPLPANGQGDTPHGVRADLGKKFAEEAKSASKSPFGDAKKPCSIEEVTDDGWLALANEGERVLVAQKELEARSRGGDERGSSKEHGRYGERDRHGRRNRRSREKGSRERGRSRDRDGWGEMQISGSKRSRERERGGSTERAERRRSGYRGRSRDRGRSRSRSRERGRSRSRSRDRGRSRSRSRDRGRSRSRSRDRGGSRSRRRRCKGEGERGKAWGSERRSGGGRSGRNGRSTSFQEEHSNTESTAKQEQNEERCKVESDHHGGVDGSRETVIVVKEEDERTIKGCDGSKRERCGSCAHYHHCFGAMAGELADMKIECTALLRNCAAVLRSVTALNNKVQLAQYSGENKPSPLDNKGSSGTVGTAIGGGRPNYPCENCPVCCISIQRGKKPVMSNCHKFMVENGKCKPEDVMEGGKYYPSSGRKE